MKKIILALCLSCCTTAITAQSLRETVEKGIQTSIRQSENHLWREAFATCRALDTKLGNGNPELHYLVSQERFRLYTRINKAGECRAQMAQMENYARASRKNEVIEDMLMKKADFARKSDNKSLATDCYNEIFNMRAKGKDDNGKEKCFKEMIGRAQKDKNKLMEDFIGRMYARWTDSIASIRTAQELSTVKAQYTGAQEEISEKDSTITSQKTIIYILIITALGLSAALVFFILVMWRNVSEIKKLKKSLRVANENNKHKGELLHNISAQIQPSLDAMQQGDTQRHVKALQVYINHIAEYMRLEQSCEEHYELTSLNMGQFCEKVTQEAKGTIKNGIEVTCSSQAINFPTNVEVLRRLLMLLIEEITKEAGVERINLEFKKRNPHTGHLLVTAVGMKMEEEEKNILFQAFAEIADLTKSDRMTYPTCSLMAYKLGGQLRLDDEFKHGVRFVIELKDK